MTKKEGARALLPKPNDPLVGELMADGLANLLSGQVDELQKENGLLARELGRCRRVCEKLSAASHRKNKRIQRLWSQLRECEGKGGGDERS